MRSKLSETPASCGSQRSASASRYNSTKEKEMKLFDSEPGLDQSVLKALGSRAMNRTG